MGIDQDRDDPDWKNLAYQAAIQITGDLSTEVGIEKIVVLDEYYSQAIYNLIDTIKSIDGRIPVKSGYPYVIMSLDFSDQHHELAWDREGELLGEFNAGYVKKEFFPNLY